MFEKLSYKETYALSMSLMICCSLFGVAAYAKYIHTEPVVLKITPWFIEKLETKQGSTIKIWTVGDGNRYFLYGNIIEVTQNQTYCVEGINTPSLQSRNPWIKVTRMYPYEYCLDENGYIQQYPVQGELPQ